MATLVAYALFAIVFMSFPAYFVGQRRGVESPGLAFIPFVGPYIVLLRSIEESGWMTFLFCVPLLNIGMGIWLAYCIPTRQGRSTAWFVWFLVPGLNGIGFWAYALTLEPKRPDTPAYSITGGPTVTTPGAAYNPTFSGSIFKD